MRRSIIFLFIICFQSILLAQTNVEFKIENFKGKEVEFNQAISDLIEGDSYFRDGNGNKEIALKYYRRAAQFNPNNRLLQEKIGKCYLEVKPKTNAIIHLKKALALSGNAVTDIPFFLGRAYHLTYNFDTAIICYNQYKRSLNPERLKENEQLIDRYIAECENGKVLYANPIRVLLDNLGQKVNSTFPDYGPVVTTDESTIFFTSRRSETTGGGKDLDDLEFYEDIYFSENINGVWSPAKNIEKPINSKFHDAIVGISPDGQTMLLYKDKNGGDIYISQLDGIDWSIPLSLGKSINSSYQEPSASISFDGKTIYFVSNRPGGYGGKDIYYCTLQKNGSWGTAVNIGATINSKYNEISVFMHPDGRTLYFSSEGHNSMGGYDIFYSEFKDNKWTEPKNLGYPINSTEDDVFLTISASGRTAYYSSSNEKGYGGQDIYKLTLLGPEKPVIFNTEDNLIASKTESVQENIVDEIINIKTNQITLVKGIIVDAVTAQPVKAYIELIDNQKNEIIATFESNKTTGKYLITLPSGKNYGINVNAEGYLFHSENFLIDASAEFRIVEKKIELQKPIIGSEIKLNNIFFDLGKFELKDESVFELNKVLKLLQDYPKMVIEISGHTDNIGDEPYNLELSTNRAKAVVDFLISNGITNERMKFIGYGFSKPVASNDTEDGRRQNRRSEIKILSQ